MDVWLLSANAAQDITPLPVPNGNTVRRIQINTMGMIKRYSVFWDYAMDMCGEELSDRLESMRISLRARLNEIQKYWEVHIQMIPEADGDELMEAMSDFDQCLNSIQKREASGTDEYPSAVPLVMLVSIMAEKIGKAWGQRDEQSFYQLLQESLVSLTNKIKASNISEPGGYPQTFAVAMCPKRGIILGSTTERFVNCKALHERARQVRIYAMKPYQRQVESIINRFDEKVNLIILTNPGKEPMDAFKEAIFSPPIEDFAGYACMAYDGRSLERKQRCARCRGTFGCQWMGVESYAKKDLKDFENHWPAMAQSSVDVRTAEAIGLCAEYQLAIGVKVRADVAT